MLLETRSHSVLHDICDLSRKTRYTSNRYDFIKTKFSRKNSKMRRPPAKIFEKIYFLFYGARSIYYPILVWNQ